MNRTMRIHDENKQREDKDLPFNGPVEWYPYHCPACGYKMWVEDIVVDAFPPDGPGRCPIIGCMKCGQDFVRDIEMDTLMSENDPNLTAE
jgi:DNA-directed RNA polymerase subunit RPC12/RpoP